MLTTVYAHATVMDEQTDVLIRIRVDWSGGNRLRALDYIALI